MEKINLTLFDCDSFFTEEFAERYFSLLPAEDQGGDVLHRCGRLLLRYLLVTQGGMTREAAVKAALETNAAGKPFLPGGPAFNISHSGRLCGCALSHSGEVGFDLEMRTKDAYETAKIAARFFSDAEREVLAAGNDPAKLFYLIWTRKESLIKYHGIRFENTARTDSASLPPELCLFAGFLSQEEESYAFSLCCRRGDPVAQPLFAMPGDIFSVLSGG